MTTSQFKAYTKFTDLEKYGDEYLINKAPFQLPNELKEFLVKFGPYIMLLFLILGFWSFYSAYRFSMLWNLG